MLWRTRSDRAWRLLDLARAGKQNAWSGIVPYPGSDEVLFFVQALDGAGNTTLLDDNGREFTLTRAGALYLPIIIQPN